jgi:anti-sigma regulatory factor (Ser/Thr protein kinase)
MSKYNFSFPTDTCSLEASTGIFNSLIKTFAIDDRSKNHLNIIVTELFTNSFIHGNEGDPQKRIDIEILDLEGRIRIRLWDEGEKLDSVEFQRLCSKIPEQYSEGGRGIAIVQKLSESMKMFRDERGRCCIEAIYKIKPLKQAIELSKSDTGMKEDK